MDLVVTIDAEEDQWGWASSGPSTIDNIRHIPALQNLFDAHGVVPTYLLTYPVAADPASAALFRGLNKAGGCEIGMHCHPWTTPPYVEPICRYNSMLCNLPVSLQSDKMRSLYSMICQQIEVSPVAFRSGRWAFSGVTAQILSKLGCYIDTSITPYTTWTDSFGPDFSRYSPQPFTLANGDGTPDASTDMVEIPVTIGYVGRSFDRCHAILTTLKRAPFRQLRVAGLLARCGVMRSVWLSPERETTRYVMRLLRQALREGCEVVNLFFHSSSLQPGCTPFVRTSQERDELLNSVSALLTFCRKSGIRTIPLSRAAHLVRRREHRLRQARTRSDDLASAATCDFH